MFGLDKTSLSNNQKQLSNPDIERIVSRSHIRSLTQAEKQAVIQAIRSARDSRGRVSIQKIDDALAGLMRKGTISDIDKAAVLKRCKTHFEK